MDDLRLRFWQCMSKRMMSIATALHQSEKKDIRNLIEVELEMERDLRQDMEEMQDACSDSRSVKHSADGQREDEANDYGSYHNCIGNHERAVVSTDRKDGSGAQKQGPEVMGDPDAGVETEGLRRRRKRRRAEGHIIPPFYATSR